MADPLVHATVDTKGMQAAFLLLSRSTQGRAVSIAASAGAGVLKKAFQAAAPKLSGATKRSITVRRVKVRGGQKRIIGPSWKRYPLRRTKKGKIRVATKKTMSQSYRDHIPGAVAHLTEHGHKGPHPAPAHPWMGPAFRNSVKAAQAKAQSKLWSEIQKGAQRARAKTR